MSDTKDVKMYYVESDIEKIQTKTNLYLQAYGSAGAFHLVREVVQNSIDECIDKDSPGNKITVEYDINTDTLKVVDNGRGFPEADYPLDIFCTKIQSGSKFFRTQSGGTSGEFGLGLTAVNALSEEFSLESYRAAENYVHKITFKDGKKVDDTKTKITKSSEIQHGSIVRFKPSKNFLGNKTVIPYKDMVEWIQKMSYFLPKGITIEVFIYKGLKLKEKYKFKAQPFVTLLDSICSDNYSQKCEFSGNSAITEKVKMLSKDNKLIEKTIKKDIHLDVALRYTKDPVTIYDTYCNYTNTTEGGIHQDTVETCFCRYMVTKTKETQSDAQKEKYKILWEDVKNGLCCVINLSTGAQVGFVGNAKTKIGNKDLVPYLTEIVNHGLDEFFKENQKCLEEYIKIIKLNTKARIEMQKVKTATQKERMDSLKEHGIKNYIRCNNTGKNQWREIFLTEGNSAAGSASNAADKDTQAFLLFRGLVANPLKCSFAEIMANEEWKLMVKVFRCGIGPTFDINKMYFKRVNIFTDSDIDGYGISSGILLFLYMYYRPLIEAGMVYKVYSPLYRIDDKNHPFVINRAEMVDIYHKKIVKKYIVSLDPGDELTKPELTEFLNDTYDYRDNLIRIAKNLGRINKYLVEAVVAYMVISGVVCSANDYDDIEKAFANSTYTKTFMSNIQKLFPEIFYHSQTNTIRGVIDGKFCIIKMNNFLIKQIEDLIPVYNKYGFRLKVTDKDGSKKTSMSIAEFLDSTTKLIPTIITRYKGLGELNADQMFETALDINNRVSIQYTVESAEKELGIFKKLHGGGKKDAELRKEMMRNYKIRREDLDN